jgi:hypothetical protein
MMEHKIFPAVCLGICVIAKYKIAQIWSTENNYRPNVINYGNSILNVCVFAIGTSCVQFCTDFL